MSPSVILNFELEIFKFTIMLALNLIKSPILFAAFIVGILIAITIHEYAHALMAYRCGDPTAKLMGRMTLNPLAHLDPMGTIFLLLVGFGWGRPVPTNPNNYEQRSDGIKVAIAGIIANLLLATLLAIPIRIATLQGINIENNIWLSLLEILADINIILAAFNILPIPPLDGSHIVEYFLDYETALTYQRYGPFLLLIVIIFDRVSNISILYIVMEPIIRIFSLITKGTLSFFL